MAKCIVCGRVFSSMTIVKKLKVHAMEHCFGRKYV